MARVVPRFLTVVAALAVAVPLHAQRKTNLLTVDEIQKAKLTASNAYEVVEMLRPRWFASHGLAKLPMTPSDQPQGVGVKIWINNHNAGGVDYLRTIPAEQVEEMRFYNQNEAASRFGPTDDAAIEVTLRR
ncbi:MAG TPA: hypothetical protein VM716_04720 [Gemmatimonadales bacterium]|nr:hypothetical protein [Gemmatimonadales bacterium]